MWSHPFIASDDQSFMMQRDTIGMHTWRMIGVQRSQLRCALDRCHRVTMQPTMLLWLERQWKGTIYSYEKLRVGYVGNGIKWQWHGHGMNKRTVRSCCKVHRCCGSCTRHVRTKSFSNGDHRSGDFNCGARPAGGGSRPPRIMNTYTNTMEVTYSYRLIQFIVRGAIYLHTCICSAWGGCPSIISTSVHPIAYPICLRSLPRWSIVSWRNTSGAFQCELNHSIIIRGR